MLLSLYIHENPAVLNGGVTCVLEGTGEGVYSNLCRRDKWLKKFLLSAQTNFN